MPKKNIKTDQSNSKKITRRKRKAFSAAIPRGVYEDMEQVYQAINKVQLTGESVTFKVKPVDSHTVLNVLRDLGVVYENKNTTYRNKSCVEFLVSPAPQSDRNEHLDDIEELPDEILEDGQIFF